MFSHFVFGSNDPGRAETFYAAVLPLLGFARLGGDAEGFAYAHANGLPRVVVARPADGRPVARANGYHVAFHAADEETVRRFHAAALAAGGSDEGGPGLRLVYAPDYYGAYVRDPDGNKLQAVTYPGGRKAGPGGDVVSHITLGSNDLIRSGAFYEPLLKTLGFVRLPAEETDAEDYAYGHAGCSLPIVFPQKTFDGRPATPGHGSHAVLLAPSRQAVAAFHREGLRLGGGDFAAPADCRDGGPPGYGAGIADPEGNAVFARCPTAPG
jgi:catechol 2,3-dioxygenase-like lactoylglutathione lyase family enzyme